MVGELDLSPINQGQLSLRQSSDPAYYIEVCQLFEPIVSSIPAKEMLDWNHVNLDMPMKNISWGVFIDGNSLEFTICDIQHKLCVC